MAWALDYFAPDGTMTDLTPSLSINGLSVPFRGNADGAAASFSLNSSPEGWAPEPNGVLRLRENNGEPDSRVWFYGVITDIDRIDLGAVAGIAPGYTITACDIGGMLKRRLVPYGNTKAERRARNLPPTINESTYNGTFTPLSTASSRDHEFVVAWALDLINSLEAAAEGTARGRLIPPFNTAATIYGKPDLVRFPAAGAASYGGSPAATGHPASNAADGNDSTYYQTTAGTGRQWTVTWTEPQAITKVHIKARSAWTKPVIEFLNSGGSVINTQTIPAIAAGGTRTLLMTSDVYPAYGMRIRESAAGTFTRSLYTVSAVDTTSFYANRNAAGVITGLPISAEKASYYELLSQIAEKSGINFYIDPGTVSTSPFFVGYNASRPQFSTYELVDGDAATIEPMIPGNTVLPVRSLSIAEASGDLANRILVEWIEGSATKPVTKRTYVPDNAKTGAGAKALALESQERYGIREKRLDREGIKSEASAVILATRELLRNLAGEVTGSARIPFDPNLRPGTRMYLHRLNHRPGTAGREYNVSVAYLASIDLGWEAGAGTEPLWMDLTFGDPSGLVTNLLLAETSVASPNAALIADRPAWGSKPTYIIGGPKQKLWDLLTNNIAHADPALIIPGGDPVTGTPVKYTTVPAQYSDPYEQTAYAYWVGGRASLPIVFNFPRDPDFVPAGARVIRAMFVWKSVADAATSRLPVWAARALPLWTLSSSTPTESQLRAEWSVLSNGRDSYRSDATRVLYTNGDSTQGLDPVYGYEFEWPGTGGVSIAVLPIAENPSTLGSVEPPTIGTGWRTVGVPIWSIAQGMYYGAPESPHAVEWNPNDPVANGWIRDPRVTDAAPAGEYPSEMYGPYLMFMIDPEAPAAGSVFEEILDFDDRQKSIDLAYQAVPASLRVTVNDVECSESNGKIGVEYNGSGFVVAINVATGDSPIRPGGLRRYTPYPGAPVQADKVIARYEVAA